MDLTTFITAVCGLLAAVVAAAVLLPRKFTPTRVGDTVYYEAEHPRQAKSVRAAWAAMVAEKAPLGVLFEIPAIRAERHDDMGLIVDPSDKRCVSWDDEETYKRLGVKHACHHVLRVRHSDPMRDTVADAVIYEYADRATRDRLIAAIPEGGPVPFVFRHMLSPETRALHDSLVRSRDA